MRNRILLPLIILTALFPCHCSAKLTIADGGAAAYVLKNSLPATALAVAMDADIIKLDLVLSKDNEVVVLSSPYLENVSNVAELFPHRLREDKHYYVLDFTIDEMRQLTLQDSKHRFPSALNPRFTISSLGEQLALIQILEKSLHKSIRIAATLIKPWLHKKEQRDLTSRTLSTLLLYGYSGQNNKTFLLSYDVEELQRVTQQLLPALQMHIQLVQLIDQADGQEHMVEEWGEMKSYNYDLLFSNSGLRALAGSVAAIALPQNMLFDKQGQAKHANFIRNAQQLGVMIFTFPIQHDTLPQLTPERSFEEELELLYFTIGVDGVFTEYCDDVSRFLKDRIQAPQNDTEETTLLPPTASLADDPLKLTSPTDMEN